MWLWLWYTTNQSLPPFKQICRRINITPWSIIRIHSNRCSWTISRTWSTLDSRMFSGLSTKRNYSTRINSRLTINNSTHCWHPKGSYLVGIYHLQAGIDPSHHGSNSVIVPQWPSMSKPTNDLPIDNVPGAPPAEDTPNKETIEPQKPDLTCTPDPTKTKAPRQEVGVENAGGKHKAKQMDCTTSIASTQNNGIHGIHFSQHTTFTRLNH